MIKKENTTTREMVAINKFFYWSMNFDGTLDWIDEIWDKNMADHLREKFMAMYDTYGAMGVINGFYGELDTENRRKLIQWVMDNYNNEIKI